MATLASQDAYEEVIRQIRQIGDSGALEGHDVGKLWDKIRDHWHAGSAAEKADNGTRVSWPPVDDSGLRDWSNAVCTLNERDSCRATQPDPTHRQGYGVGGGAQAVRADPAWTARAAGCYLTSMDTKTPTIETPDMGDKALKALHPRQREIVEDVMAQHPDLTVEEAIEACRAGGM